MTEQGPADQTEGKERQVQAVETRMLSWVATTSLGKTGWQGKVVELLFMCESSYTVLSTVQGQIGAGCEFVGEN